MKCFSVIIMLISYLISSGKLELREYFVFRTVYLIYDKIICVPNICNLFQLWLSATNTSWFRLVFL